MPPWVYILAAILGSLLGAGLDALLYREGGSMFMKIGLVALPIVVYLVAKRRAKGDDTQ